MKKILVCTGILFLLTAVLAFQQLHKYIDLFTDLGIEKSEANEWISDNFFSGGTFFVLTEQMKKLAPEKRGMVVKQLGDYIRSHVESPAFSEQYKKYREEMTSYTDMNQGPNREEMIATFIKSLESDQVQIQDELKRATGPQKVELETALKQVREALQALRDPKSPLHKKYFDLLQEEQMPDRNKSIYDDPEEEKKAMAEMKKYDEEEYPLTAKAMIAKRLKEFLAVSATVDFNAKLQKVGSKYYFVDKKYEEKDDTWKRLYRCGKETILPARAYAQQWLASMK